jgi:hypothetical protein
MQSRAMTGDSTILFRSLRARARAIPPAMPKHTRLRAASLVHHLLPRQLWATGRGPPSHERISDYEHAVWEPPHSRGVHRPSQRHGAEQLCLQLPLTVRSSGRCSLPGGGASHIARRPSSSREPIRGRERGDGDCGLVRG